MRASGRIPGWDQASQAESGDQAQPVDGPVVGRGQLGDLPGRHVDGQQPAVVRGRGDGGPVRGGGQAEHVAEETLGEPDGLGLRLIGHRGDLERVVPGGVGDPDHLAGVAEHPRQPRPGAGIYVQRTGRAVPVRQPVHRTPHLDHAGLTGLVRVEAAEVVLRRDQPGGAAHGRGAEGDVQFAGLGRVRAVQDPDVPGHVVDDPLPVGGRVPGVPAVMIGMPGDAAAVQRAGIDVAGALMIRQEEQPPADQHRGAELAIEVGEHPGEERILVGGDPQLAAGAAPVALPVRGLVVHPAGEQRAARLLQGQVDHRAERQPPRRRALERDRVRPGQVRLGLTGGGDRENFAGPGPAGHAGPRVAPVGEPVRVVALRVGRVDLRVAVPPAGPGDPAAVAREARVAHLGVVGREPPGPAAVGGSEPDVFLGGEDEQITVNVRVAQVSRTKSRTSSYGLRSKASRARRRCGAPRRGSWPRSSGCTRTGSSAPCPRRGRAGRRSRRWSGRPRRPRARRARAG